jgi:hypothetical protein
MLGIKLKRSRAIDSRFIPWYQYLYAHPKLAQVSVDKAKINGEERRVVSSLRLSESRTNSYSLKKTSEETGIIYHGLVVLLQ